MKMDTIHCMACDMVIQPSGKDAVSGGGSSSKKPQKPNHVTGPVELKAVRRYFLKDTSKDVEDVLLHFKYQLPFCSFCMDLVAKICDFEDEIIHLKQLIDSMVSCIKMKIQVSLENGSHRPTDENTIRLRASMVGVKSWQEKYGQYVRVEPPDQVSDGNEAGNHSDTSISPTDIEEDEEEKGAANDETSATIIKVAEEESVIRTSTTSEASAEDKQEQSDDGSQIVVTVGALLGSIEESSENQSRRSTRVSKSKNPKYSDFLDTDEVVSEHENLDDDDRWQEEEEYDKTHEELDDQEEDEDDDDEDEDSYDVDDFEELLELPERYSSSDRNPKRVVTEFEPKKYRFEGIIFTLLEDQKYQCEACQKILKTRGGALIHIKNVHLSGPREIKKKGRPSKNPDEVPTYKRRKTERRQRPVTVLGPDQFEFQGLPFSKRDDGRFQCGSCPNILKTRDSVLVHIKQRHLGEGLGTFLCHLCGKSFDRDVYLKVHEINHLNPKSLHCEICGKAFTQYANLYNHKKIHTGQLNFHCEFENCGKKFLTRKQLTTHVRRHTGDRPYQCELCPKRFVRGSELTIHMRSHSEDRPYECHLCDSKFFIKGRLKRHLKNVHKMDTVGETTIEAVPTESIVIEVPTTQVEPGGQQHFVQPSHFLTLHDLY